MKPKLLVIDQDESMRSMFQNRLADSYDVVETGDPAQAIALTLENKPAAILLDIVLPGLSGFELCQSLRSLSYTSHIPVFVITSESNPKYKSHCESLGVRAYFQKPVEFLELARRLSEEVHARQPDTRAHARIHMRVPLKLRGMSLEGKEFEVLTATENVSASGFLCTCSASLAKGAEVKVYLAGQTERFAGKVVVVRREAPGAPWQRYGFTFKERTAEWVFH
jgi:DNA-binding response OmpR family regulator